MYRKTKTPKIPLKSHRIWVTDPENPRELVDVFVDPKIVQEFLDTLEVLNAAGPEKWEHYLWTNDKTLIPRSVEWVTKAGIVVKELKELPSFDKEWNEIFDDYIFENTRVGAASDFAR